MQLDPKSNLGSTRLIQPECISFSLNEPHSASFSLNVPVRATFPRDVPELAKDAPWAFSLIQT